MSTLSPRIKILAVPVLGRKSISFYRQQFSTYHTPHTLYKHLDGNSDPGLPWHVTALGMCLLVTNSQRAENKKRQCLPSSEAPHWSELRTKNHRVTVVNILKWHRRLGCLYLCSLRIWFYSLIQCCIFLSILLLEKGMKSAILNTKFKKINSTIFMLNLELRKGKWK